MVVNRKGSYCLEHTRHEEVNYIKREKVHFLMGCDSLIRVVISYSKGKRIGL